MTTLQLKGDAVGLGVEAAVYVPTSRGFFSGSDNSVIAYSRGTSVTDLTGFDRPIGSPERRVDCITPAHDGSRHLDDS
jgi:hypothetical protein